MINCSLCKVNKAHYTKLKLCRYCFSDEKKKGNIKKRIRKEREIKQEKEWTEKELNELIEEQRKNLPDWWKDEVPFSKDDQ